MSLLVSLSSIAATREPPKEFHGIKWGSAPAKGMKKFSGPTNDGTSIYVPRSGTTPKPFLNIPVHEEVYSYTYQRFYSGSAWFDGQPNLELLKSALLKVYGPASFANEERRIWRWRWPNSKVEIMLYYQDRFSRTTVTFLNNDI